MDLERIFSPKKGMRQHKELEAKVYTEHKSFAEMSKITQITIALIILSDVVVFFTAILFEILELHLVFKLIEHSFWILAFLYFIWSLWVASHLMERELDA